MRASAAAVLLCIVLAVALGVYAADDSSERGLIGCSDCYRQLGETAESRSAMKAGLEQALNWHAKNRCDLARKATEDALKSGGFVCEWQKAREAFECRLGQ